MKIPALLHLVKAPCLLSSQQILQQYYTKNICTHWDFELFSSSNHISPLLNRPQGCQGCQKNRKDLRITTTIRFAANFQPKLNEWHKILQNQQKSWKYAGFLVIFQIFFKFGWKLAAKRIMVVNLRSFRFFWHPWHPWGWLSSGDIWVLRFVLNILLKWRRLADFFQVWLKISGKTDLGCDP